MDARATTSNHLPGPCLKMPYSAKNSISRSLVRRMPIWPLGMIPKRYSRPICAPVSIPKKSAARSPKSPLPSGRVKRWVTRNALPNFGSRNAVGSAISVKSGSASFKAASSTDCAQTAGANRSTAKRAQDRRIANGRVTSGSLRLVAWCAERDPAFENQDLSVGQKRWAALRHSDANDADAAYKLLHQVAVLGITRDDAHAGLTRAHDI